MTLCYFTASGNCLYVARQVGGTLLSIPQLMKQDSIEIEDDAVGIIAPVYGAELPFIISDFMKKASIKTDYLFVILTCGYGYLPSLGCAEDIARERGWNIKYANGVMMVDNYLPYFDMNEEREKTIAKDVDGQLEKICKDIADRKEQPIVITSELRERMDWVHSNHFPKVMNKNMALGYMINDNCIHCGICSKVCPANNISVTDDKVIFSDHCEVCYACLHNCPQKAIYLKEEKNPAVRFRNEHISLSDIIESNQ